MFDLCNGEKLKQNEWKTAKATFGIRFRLSANCFSIFGFGYGQEFSFWCIPRINLSNISWERKLLSQIWLSMNNAIINAACIITQYGSMQKIGFSFIFFLSFLFYVIKEKAALELEGVLVSGCEFACMLMCRLNRNRVKTNQIGQ